MEVTVQDTPKPFQFRDHARFLSLLLPWQRVLLRIEVDFETGCWNYTGQTINPGTKSCYGQITWREDGKRLSDLAHRIIYRKFKGEIPKGREVCHSCDNPRCVNPEHLWHGSRAQNQKDCFDKGRSKSTFVLAAFDARKEKRRKYQREWHREYRRRKREES